jgi:hypothetical protein
MIVKVYIPLDNVHKAVRLDPQDTVWSAKMLVIDKLQNNTNPDLLNYGIFQPSHGKDGRWLDDQRPLKIYDLEENVSCCLQSST